MRAKISIAIADDHELYLRGLKDLLKKQSNIEVVGEAKSGNELIALAKRLKPDIIITDLKMPDGTGHEATSYISQHLPEINVIALSMADDDYSFMDMIMAGAKAYLVKNASSAEILEAVNAVQNNNSYFCKVMVRKAAKLIVKDTQKPGSVRFTVPQFNEKERQIFYLMCQEFTSKEIAEKLGVSVRAVESKKDGMFKKTKSKNSAGLIMFAVMNHFHL